VELSKLEEGRGLVSKGGEQEEEECAELAPVAVEGEGGPGGKAREIQNTKDGRESSVGK